LNSMVGSKKYNADIELLSGVSQWRLTPGVNKSFKFFYKISVSNQTPHYQSVHLKKLYYYINH
jgi:hypothetical protein